MGCDVCIGGDIGDCDYTYTVIEERVVDAPHKCCECRVTLVVGETHQYASSHEDKAEADEFGREFFEAWTCSICAEIRKVFSCGEGQMWESLWDDMEEHAFPSLTTASECFTELSAEAKVRVLEEWRKWKGLKGK